MFDLVTLDTRLGPSDDVKRRDGVVAKAGPSRWRSPEFIAYYIIHLVALPIMFKGAYDASNPPNPNYELIKKDLEPGWMFGRQVDNTDHQYSGFRDNLPYLAAVIVAQQLLKRLFKAFSNDTRFFDVGFAFLFLIVAHGVSTVKILAIIIANYMIGSKVSNSKAGTIATWVFGIAILFANEKALGYPFTKYCPPLAFLDDYAGLMPRWDVTFNFSMLRMVSFNVDRYRAVDGTTEQWPLDTKGEIDLSKSKTGEGEKNTSLTASDISERSRIDVSHSNSTYSMYNYLLYMLYSPLFMAGPIMTFNDFIFQHKKGPLASLSLKRVSFYALRLVFCILVMETLLHFCYVVAVSQEKAWAGDSAFQISMIGFFNLNIIWLKLLIPWRLFRLWSMIDGIDPPENMVRCMDNNFSALSFWRAWHRSFNRWIIRYVYGPIGGSSRPILNSLIVFSFVAIWHDIQLRLLVWGWMVVFFIIPELTATFVFKRPQFTSKWWFRHLCAAGAALNIWMMMIANLVGFCVGLDGMGDMLKQMFGTRDGIIYCISASCALFVGSQVMFEVRESEKRRGINIRC